MQEVIYMTTDLRKVNAKTEANFIWLR